MYWLANEGFRVIGVELSPIACNEFFAEMNTSPQITHLSKFTSYKHNNIELLCGKEFNQALFTPHLVLPPLRGKTKWREIQST
jgi:Thiopurine S-methyltransferase (TPMT)